MAKSNNLTFGILIVIVIIIIASITPYILEKIENENHSSSELQNNLSNENTYQKESATIEKENHQNINKIITNDTSKQNNTLKDKKTKNQNTNLRVNAFYKKYGSFQDWVVVDCENQLILKCPHFLIKDKTTPTFPAENTSNYLQGKCRDVTVSKINFCGF